MELLAIFSYLEFGLKFTFTISVTGVVYNVNVSFACRSMEAHADQLVRRKVEVHWLITSSNNSQLRGIVML